MRVFIQNTVTYTNFSPRVSVSLYLIHDRSLLPFYLLQEKGKERPRERLARSSHGMQSKAEATENAKIPATLRAASRSHAPNLIFILVPSLKRRLVVPLTSASGTLVSTVRVAARLAAPETDLRHFDGRGGALDWWEVGRGLLVVGG
jgi:hypothetical protein